MIIHDTWLPVSSALSWTRERISASVSHQWQTFTQPPHILPNLQEMPILVSQDLAYTSGATAN